MKTFISPGSWFSIEYPDNWCEFEEDSDDFLFYDPDEWNGNFRVSVYRDRRPEFGHNCLQDELRVRGTSLVTLGKWTAAHSVQRFAEDGHRYDTHIWTVDAGKACAQCTFTVFADASPALGETVVKSLTVNPEGTYFSHTLIPVRLKEMYEIDDACSTAEQLARKVLKARFGDLASSLNVLQRLADSGSLKGADGAVVLGMTFCSLVAENVDGFEWRTLVDGPVEHAVLVAGTKIAADPTTLFAGKTECVDVEGTFERLMASVS